MVFIFLRDRNEEMVRFSFSFSSHMNNNCPYIVEIISMCYIMTDTFKKLMKIVVIALNYKNVDQIITKWFLFLDFLFKGCAYHYFFSQETHYEDRPHSPSWSP